MDIKQFLTQQFNQEFTLEKTTLGLTNTLYTTTFQNQKVAVRVVPEPLKNSSAFSNEQKALELVKPLNLDVPEIFYDAQTRVRITVWIENGQEFSNYPNQEEAIVKVAQLLKKLHQANLRSGSSFDGISLLNEYQSKILNPLYDYDFFSFILDDYRKINNPQVLCHNDVVSGNILFSPDQDYLIDYEYSKDNDPLFDIMSFFTENNLVDEPLRSLFYEHYFGHAPSPTQQEDLKCYEQFHNYLWCCWANMMFDLLKEPIYLEIAKNKYEALCKCIEF